MIWLWSIVNSGGSLLFSAKFLWLQVQIPHAALPGKQRRPVAVSPAVVPVEVVRELLSQGGDKRYKSRAAERWNRRIAWFFGHFLKFQVTRSVKLCSINRFEVQDQPFWSSSTQSTTFSARCRNVWSWQEALSDCPEERCASCSPELSHGQTDRYRQPIRNIHSNTFKTYCVYTSHSSRRNCWEGCFLVCDTGFSAGIGTISGHDFRRVQEQILKPVDPG